MPKIDIKTARVRIGSTYPPPYDEPCRGVRETKLGAAGGLSQFGVNLVRLPPGR